MLGALLLLHGLQKLITLTPPPPSSAVKDLKVKPGDLPKPKESSRPTSAKR